MVSMEKLGEPARPSIALPFQVRSHLASEARATGPATTIVQIATLAATYYLVARAGLSLAHLHDNVTLFWPPTGLSLAALIVYGWRLWPGVFLGALVVSWSTGGEGILSLGIAVGNTLEACLGALLLERVVHFRPSFERVQDIGWFVLIGGLGCTVASATVGVASLVMFGESPIASPGLVWLIWWLGDVGGAIVVAPLLLLARHGSPRWASLTTQPEALLLLFFLVGTSALAFGGLLDHHWALLASFFPFPFVVAAGVRLGTRGAVLGSAVVTLIAIAGSATGQGPFITAETHTSMMLLWSYVMVLGMASLTVASAIAQRDHAQQRHLEGERERLEIAQKMNQKQRLESLGLLAGGIAHDFNNILTIIAGNAVLLRSSLDESHPGQEKLDKIATASERAADLCQQLLGYAGRGNPNRTRVSLGEMAEETCSLIRSSIPQDVTLELAPTRSPTIVLGDVTQLRQIVMNLVLNAADAIGGKSGSITLALDDTELTRAQLDQLTGAAQAQPGRFAVLDVVDTGSGMTPDISARIFDPFFTTKLEGHGLGLGSVVGIVQSHGGGIDVESNSPRGTRFRVFLPLAPEEDEVEAVEERTAPGAAPGGLILVADDEPDVRELVVRVLQSNGYQTLSAADGQEALELFHERSGDIVALLLDVRMPRKTGPEVLQELSERAPHVPVLLMSGYDETQDGRETQPAAYLRKPFSVHQLLSALRRAIESAEARVPGDPG